MGGPTRCRRIEHGYPTPSVGRDGVLDQVRVISLSLLAFVYRLLGVYCSLCACCVLSIVLCCGMWLKSEAHGVHP